MDTAFSDTYSHGLKRGDHVIRWTNILIYPIQVHGIVLSAGDEIVTIVDFGLTANNPTQHKINQCDNDDQENNHDLGQNETNTNTSLNLEEMVNQEDRVMMQACDEHRKEQVGAERFNIMTLTDRCEIERWKKIDYGESLKKQWEWRWWKKDGDANSKVDREDAGDQQVDSGNESGVTSSMEEKIETLSEKEADKMYPQSPGDISTSKHEGEKIHSSASSPHQQVPKLPKSDPENMVIARVRYIITNPEVLPAHHILFSNSECIAVWCKTGRWSTLQASIFLQSTAAGNLKSSFLLATGVGTATVTTTVPAGGVAGWLGFTTTSTVSLLSVQPWLIPLLAGYGLLTVGTPLILFQKAKERWEKATVDLNDSFWSSVDSDVYVEAIKSWSALV